MARSSATIRLGIVGCGRVAWERHLPPLLEQREIQVVAAADVDAGRCNRLAERFGDARRFTDYRALLDCPDVDAVAVLTPTQSHCEIGVAALEAGKHLFIEKPLALTMAECDRLTATAANSKSKVVVGFNLRWHRLVRRAREFLATGALGRIKAIRSVYTHDRTGENAPHWHRKLELGGGVGFNEAVHHFDLWRYFLRTGVEQVFSFNIPSPQYEEETSVVTARMENGILASGIFSFLTGPNSELEIYGEAGRLCISLYRFDGLEFFPYSKFPGDLKDRFGKTLASISALPEVVLQKGGAFQATFSGLWRHFVECIIHDRASECTLEDGRNSVRIALAALESARSGLPVCLAAEASRA